MKQFIYSINSNLNEITLADKIQDSTQPFYRLWFNENCLVKNEITELSFWEDYCKQNTLELSPDAFIFHTGRCGSSMLVNFFQLLTDSIVLPEAQPIGLFTTRENPNIANWLMKKKMAMNNLLTLYQNLLCTKNEKFIIKFASWNILGSRGIIDLYPNKPVFFLYRDPESTLASMLNTDSGLLSLNKNHILRDTIFPFSGRKMNDIEFLSECLNAYYQEILNILLLNNKNHYLINYQDINAAILSKIQSLLSINSENKGAALESIKFYSKDLNSKLTYSKNISAKKLGKPILSTVNSICLENYERLQNSTHFQ